MSETTNHGPVKQPPVENAPVSADVAELLGTGPRVGDPVYYVYQPGESWAALVVRVKENDKLDLVVFRPDGNTVRAWDCPRGNRLRIGDCWAPRD